MAAEMRSPNISVTPINVDVYHHPVPSSTMSSGEPPPDGADAEVARIEFHSSVNMRVKQSEEQGGNHPPRPMSWEGELSDHDSNMCVDEDSTHQVKIMS